ncbi:hypothetical protein GXN76_06580 [Kroppenstedtia pulmonis]|uniref:YqhG family protein n=1 Tax=Kroppenstedtia pulmonis TaxID=1380685 RepID=A0A7D4BJ77_9BACL|nr:YqhG family protein [Kroppenstedtia pulmonis]QKG84170.1 hypothetical protein GXN76_06580 [Kroppenstedtia pulmonis]
MGPDEVKTFTERYMESLNCHILEQSPHHLEVQLSVEADKDLIHRPFYWMYVEKMGLPPNPSRLAFTFTPDQAPPGVRGELLSFGSPRFTHILNSARKNGQFVRLYEDTPHRVRYTGRSRAYEPWLGIQYQISYICDQKKDEILSQGIHLRSGETVTEFYDKISNRNWSSKLPTYRHILPPLLSIPEAVGELEYALEGYIQSQDLNWARSAKDLLDAELQRIHAYYPDEWRMSDELHAEKKQRIREAVWQYHPRVEVETVNAGLFFLDEGSISLSPAEK